MSRICHRLTLLGFLFSLTACAEKVQVTFRVVPASVPEGEQVFIVGDLPELGNWNPAAVPMERQADGTWLKTIEAPRGKRIEYKITRGNWLVEALGEDLRIPRNHVLRVGLGASTVTVHVAKWRDEVASVRGQITGQVRYHRDLKGEGIRPRDVIVWLPPGYDDNADRRYPVLYMHDGQNAFDPATTTYGVDWQVDEEATRLIGEGKIEEIIIVGIYNTPDRGEEYGRDEKLARAYMRFIVDELKPFIDATYRTRPGREDTATMGSSMGGLIAFLLAWERPDVFSKAACLSPAFIAGNWLKEVKVYKGPAKNIRIYMDNGGVGLERRLQIGCDKMLRILPTKGFKRGENLEWYLDPKAEHNEAAWAARVWRPLTFLFGVPRV